MLEVKSGRGDGWSSICGLNDLVVTCAWGEGEARVIVVRIRDTHNECPPLREVLWPVLAACQAREPVAEELIR